MKTFSAKAQEVQRDWYVVDGTDQVLGRLAAEIARRLRGKHKPEFTPHVHYRHSGYPGGISSTTFSKMQDRFPGRALEKAVKGMLPKGPLGYAMIKKLKVYADDTHPHAAQQPKPLQF